MTVYKIRAKVLKMEHRTKAISARKQGEEVVIEREDIGWFVVFEHSYEALYLGKEKPELHPDQWCTITIVPDHAP